MNKKYVYFIPLFIILLSALIYVGFINSFHNLGASNNKFVNILHVYKSLPSNSIFFLGDSQIREDIDCSLIESAEIPCFNFGIAGILPIQIALQKNLIASSRPKKVVFGVSPLFFNEDLNKNDDLFFLMASIKEDIFLEGCMLDQLTSKEKELIFMNSIDQQLYKRKFILPFYVGLIKSVVSSEKGRTQIEDNFKNPYYFTKNQDTTELSQKVKDSNILKLFEENSISVRQKDAFECLIKLLYEENIEIMILQLPLNPLLFDELNNKTLLKYHDYLSELTYKYDIDLVNIEEDFDKEQFMDLTHLNKAGRKELMLKLRGDYNII